MKPWQDQGFLLDTLRHFKIMDGQFKIRSYGYGELALLYFPNSTKKSASTQLGRWVRQHERLKIQLQEKGYKKGNKILSPSQVKILTEHLGEP